MVSSRWGPTKARVSSRQTRHGLSSHPAPPPASSSILLSCLHSHLCIIFQQCSRFWAIYEGCFLGHPVVLPSDIAQGAVRPNGMLKLTLKLICWLQSPRVLSTFSQQNSDISKQQLWSLSVSALVEFSLLHSIPRTCSTISSHWFSTSLPSSWRLQPRLPAQWRRWPASMIPLCVLHDLPAT